MKIERVISWFNKHTEELKGEFLLDGVSLESPKAIFKPKAENGGLFNTVQIVVMIPTLISLRRILYGNYIFAKNQTL